MSGDKHFIAFAIAIGLAFLVLLLRLGRNTTTITKAGM